MAYPDAVVYRFSDAGIEEVAYESSDQVVLMRDFMADPARFVHYLLMEED
jgi:predicted ATPase